MFMLNCLLGLALFSAGQDASAPSSTAGQVVLLEPFPAGYLGPEAIAARVRQLAEANPERLKVRSIARTAEGRDVWMASFGDAGEPGSKPAILLVAGLDADHMVGSQVAMALVERLIAQTNGDLAKRLTERATLHVVPCLNPDGMAALLKAPHAPIRGNLRGIDRDRDGVSGEDGPQDVDGDGFVTGLRVRDRKASLVAEADDPRISKPAGSSEAGLPMFSEYVEGRDSDLDGALAEDPAGGVLLDRNWPQKWPEFEREAGATPVSEPETRGLIQYLFEHPEVSVVWAFGMEDTLREEPKKPGATYDDSDMPQFVSLHKLYSKQREGLAKGVDVPVPGEVGTMQELAGQAIPPEQAAVEAPSSTWRLATAESVKGGSFVSWAYQQYGALTMGSRLWMGPDFPEPAEGRPAAPKDGEARWLYWNDRVLGGRGYVPFREFEHPTLGKVSIGGWKAGVRTNPPASQITKLVEVEESFLVEVASRLPRLAVPLLSVEPRGEGLFEIVAVVENQGEFPTALAQGVKTRAAMPVLVRLKPGKARLIGGRALQRIDTLAGSGGRREFRWVVMAGEGRAGIELEVSCPRAGRIVKEVVLP